MYYGNKDQEIIKAVLDKVKKQGDITLDIAKKVLEATEEIAKKRRMNCVMAICNSHGNPVAVHVMEDAFLVSYEVATQKAYSAVAVKMSTRELQRMVQPGGTFYGLESMQNGKIVAFGGGIPLEVDGRIVGGLGISGGTGDQDHEIALAGKRAFDKIMKELK